MEIIHGDRDTAMVNVVVRRMLQVGIEETITYNQLIDEMNEHLQPDDRYNMARRSDYDAAKSVISSAKSKLRRAGTAFHSYGQGIGLIRLTDAQAQLSVSHTLHKVANIVGKDIQMIENNASLRSNATLTRVHNSVERDRATWERQNSEFMRSVIESLGEDADQ